MQIWTQGLCVVKFYVVDFDNCLGLSQSNLTTAFSSIRRKILLCLETKRRARKNGKERKERNVEGEECAAR
jgi:hypothetical protein